MIDYMFFNPQATPEEIPLLLRRFKTLAEWEKLDRRLKQIEAEHSCETKRYYIENRFGLELSLIETLKYQKATNRIPWPPNIAQYELFSFLAMAIRLHNKTTEAGKKNIKGDIKKAIDGSYGLAPFAFEMKIVANLMQAGFDVELTDIENKEQYDFLASKNGKEIEVECKHISADLGRKIHQNKLSALAKKLKSLMDECQKSIEENICISISLNDRLNNHLFDKLTASVQKILSTNIKNLKHPDFEIEARLFSDDVSPFKKFCDEKTMRDFVSKNYNVEKPHAFVSYHPNGKAILVNVSSKKQDTVLDSIVKKMSENSKSQLTGTKPGALCVFLSELSEEQLLELQAAQESQNVGLQIATNHVLNKRQHLHTIAYMSQGKLKETRYLTGNKQAHSYMASGSVYYFVNPNNEFCNDPDYQIFGENQ